MIFEINGNNVELKFNIGAIRKLDQMYQGKIEGFEFGAGLMIVNMQLRQYNPTALANVIDAATPKRYTQHNIDEAVNVYAEENDGLESLFKEISDELGKSAIVKDTLKRMNELEEEVQEKE